MCGTAQCASVRRSLIIADGSKNRVFSDRAIQILMRREYFTPRTSVLGERHERHSGQNRQKGSDMKTQALKADKFPHLSIEMMWICLAGLAVAMGWIPT